MCAALILPPSSDPTASACEFLPVAVPQAKPFSSSILLPCGWRCLRLGFPRGLASKKIVRRATIFGSPWAFDGKPASSDLAFVGVRAGAATTLRARGLVRKTWELVWVVRLLPEERLQSAMGGGFQRNNARTLKQGNKSQPKLFHCNRSGCT